MRFLIAATIATLAIGTTSVNAQIESEIEVLKALARSTGNWENLKSHNMGPWLESSASSACSVGGWNSVICEKIADQDRVVEISFPAGQKINGTISAIEFNKLPYLRKLHIADTELTGTLPNLSTHPTLKSLLVWWNSKLTGPITTQNIPPQLEIISIANPIIQGPLPSFDAVNATTLKAISFESVQVTGTLPSFERFINLEDFNMRSNNITGAVPRFGPSLRSLALSSNQLTAFDVANIPVTVQDLDLHENKIVAPFPNLAKLTDPRKIDLSNNGFNGNVPLASIPPPSKGFNATLTEPFTYYVDFKSNYFTGPVPAFTNEWLQSRAAPGVTHKLRWSPMCNLFQTGLPSLQVAESTCYDNKDNSQNCATYCIRANPPPSSGTTPPPSSTANTPPPTNTTTNTTTSPPTKPAGPKNDATATTATSVFTGVAAVIAAFAARF